LTLDGTAQYNETMGEKSMISVQDAVKSVVDSMSSLDILSNVSLEGFEGLPNTANWRIIISSDDTRANGDIRNLSNLMVGMKKQRFHEFIVDGDTGSVLSMKPYEL